MSRELKRVCVFAGSSPGVLAAYADCATALGRELASQGIGVVYGGAQVGLMGLLANAALGEGGEVIGGEEERDGLRRESQVFLPQLQVLWALQPGAQPLAIVEFELPAVRLGDPGVVVVPTAV